MSVISFVCVSLSNNILYVKCVIRWVFVHGSLTTLFAAIAEVQKNNPPPPSCISPFFLKQQRWGFSASQHSPHQEKYVFSLGCVTLYLLLQLYPLDQVLPLVTLSGAYRRVQQRDKFGPLFVSKHPGNDMGCLIRQHKRK